MSQLQIPRVTLEDLQTFQAKHFLGHQTPACDYPTAPAKDAYYPYEEEEYYDDDGDDLGYYPDGVKRTLTDEQIRIFRHSEIHAILRERQLKQEKAEFEKSDEQAQGQTQTVNAKRKREDEDNDEGGSKRVGSKQAESARAGVGSGSTALHYDDEQEPREVQRPTTSAPFAGRRIISYED
ncbi:hypothetical protein SI65_04744 [Aspergillus cristatus]|uniref:Uncharacterized protein n=1 Tax=Aspergillus cristatus TaxID=573508 RepID=A0A1E3BFT6_ASPCR|nr:hypothetical protein SI65_04744 [Aspergillus cristatus]